MAEPVLISIPHESVNDDSVRILAWKVPSGAPVAKEQLLCEVETSKAVLEIHAPSDGFVIYSVAAGDEVPIGDTLCSIHSEPVNQPEAKPQALQTVRLSAAARRAAAAFGIDTASFPPGAMVRESDVLRAAGKPAHEQRPAHTDSIDWTDLPRRKLLEGRLLLRGRDSTVQSSVTSVCRISDLPAPGLQATIIFETARLLNKYPVFNSVFDAGRAGRYRHVNIGWALDAGQGLVVPVIHHADQKTLLEIGNAMEQQTEAYLEGTLSPADFLGATFTVTDLSGQNVSFFQPLLAEGQSAILGVGEHRGHQELYLTLAFDHQLAEGRTAAEFLRDLCQRLEMHSNVASVAKEIPLPFCALCQRDSKTLQEAKLVLLKSEVPPGFVCSMCAAGW